MTQTILNMKSIYNKMVIAGLSLLLITASCKKGFLDVNKNPNNPADATVELVLPTALGYAAYDCGNQYQILGGFWSQYWTQGPTAGQYLDLDNYNVNATDYERPWGDMYASVLADLAHVVSRGTTDKKPNHVAMAKIMQAYSFQILTDMHGDIPFSDALKGASDNNTNPKYDNQKDIYNGLLKLIGEAQNIMDDKAAMASSEDLIFGGDLYAWYKFSNTLKLRILMRLTEVAPSLVKDSLTAMQGRGEPFMEMGDLAQVLFYNVQYNKNPLSQTFVGLATNANIVASNTALNYYNSNNDPRIDYFYATATTGAFVGKHAGIDQGEGRLLPNPGSLSHTNYSLPSGNVGGPVGGEAAPVVFMSAAESYFLQSEAVARGYMTGDAKALYNSGVSASFLGCGLAQTDADTFLTQATVTFPDAGSVSDKVKSIITQKWAAMNGTHNIEPWNDYRRTGYPDFFIQSKGSVIGAGKMPARIPYPSSELTRNKNFPGQKSVTDKVWWDVN
jgi:hypothetical protein